MIERILVFIIVFFVVVAGVCAQHAAATAVWGGAGAIVFDAAGTGSSSLICLGAGYRVAGNVRLFASLGYTETVQQSIYTRSSDERNVRVPYFLGDIGAEWSPFEGRLFPFLSAGVGIAVDPRSSTTKEIPSPAAAVSGIGGIGLAYDVTERIGLRVESRMRYCNPSAFALSSLETIGGIAFLF